MDSEFYQVLRVSYFYKLAHQTLFLLIWVGSLFFSAMTGRSSFGFRQTYKLVLSQLERPIQRCFAQFSRSFVSVCTVMGNYPRGPKHALFKAAREYKNCLLQRQVSVLFQSYFPSDRLAEKVDKGL